MPYQPTNPYPYNTAVDLEEGLEFRFRADNYDIINSFEIELYDLLKNKKLYTINRCIGDIQDNKIVKGTKQLLQVFDENEEQVYLNEFLDSESSILPLKSKRNNLNLGVLNLSGYLATIEQIEKRKYYSEVDNAEDLMITKSEAFEIDENGVIVSYNSEMLSVEEKKNIVIPYELPFTNQNGTQKIKVTGISDNVFANNNELETIVIPSTVVFLGVLKEPEGIEGQEKEVEGIQITGAFCKDKNLKEVVLNYGISKIGTNCFWGCNNLADFNFIDSIDEIGENAFRECEKLLRVNCPTDLKRILAGTFRESGVKFVHLSKNLQKIDCYAFYKSKIVQLETPSELQFIGEKAFSNNVNLNEIKIAEGLTQCNKEAFANCSFTKVVLPESLDSLGMKIFENCNKLEELTLPIVSTNKIGDLFSETQSSVPTTLKKINIIATENIPDYFFEGIGSLQEVSVEEGLKKIGVGSFAGCKQLVKFDCPSTLENIADRAFQAEVVQGINSNVTVSMANLFVIYFSKIQSSHSFSIGKNVFKNRNNMKEIILPNFISDIGVGTFCGCFKSSLGEVNLTLPLLKSKSTEEEKTKGFKRYFVDEDKNYTLVFPSNLKKVVVSQVEGNQIEDKAFCFSETKSLSSIKKIELPDSVTKIGEKAFYNIDFSTFTMPYSVNDIGQKAFNFLKTCNLYWTTILDSNSDLVTNSLNTKINLFGSLLTTCFGNKGVVAATSQQGASIYNFEGNETFEDANKHILLNGKIVANYSAPSCFFGIENVTTVSGQCGANLRYEIKDNTLFIQGYGDMYDYQSDDSSNINTPWFGNRNKITTINLPQGLTKIGDYAFSKFSVLNQVNFEESQVDLVIGDCVFQDCVGLTELVLPKRIINIGKNILYGCYNIQKIEFPSVVNNNADFKNLGYLWRKDNSSFSLDNTKWLTYNLDSIYYCIPLSLKEVIVSKKLSEKFFCCKGWRFGSSVEQGIDLDYVKILDEQANNLKLFGENNYTIGTLDLKLSQNQKVTDVIGYSADPSSYHSKITNLIVHSKYEYPYGVTYNVVINGIVDLTDTTYTSQNLEKYAALQYKYNNYRTQLPQTLKLPDTCTYLNNTIIYGFDYSYDNKHYLKQVSGNNIVRIASGTFYESIVETLDFPELTFVGKKAFFNCKNLKQFTKGEEEGIIKIKSNSINEQAFVNCSNLKKAKITFVRYDNSYPYWHQYLDINAEAFVGCENLEEIEIVSNKPYNDYKATVRLNGGFNFANCKKLKNFNKQIVLGSKPQYDASDDYVPGVGAFLNCKEFVWDNSVNNKNNAQDKLYLNYKKIPPLYFFGCNKILNKCNNPAINLNSEVTEIGSYAFAGIGLKQLTFSNYSNITSIGVGAFMGFLGTQITLPFIGTSPTISEELDSDYCDYSSGGYLKSSCMSVFGAFSGEYKDINNEKPWNTISNSIISNIGFSLSYSTYVLVNNNSNSFSYDNYFDQYGQRSFNSFEQEAIAPYIQDLADELDNAGEILRTCINGYEHKDVYHTGYEIIGGLPMFLTKVIYTQSPNQVNPEAFRNCVLLEEVEFPQQIQNFSTKLFGPFHSTLRSLSFQTNQFTMNSGEYLVEEVNTIKGNDYNKVTYKENIKKAFYNTDTTQWMGLGRYRLSYNKIDGVWNFNGIDWFYDALNYGCSNSCFSSSEINFSKCDNVNGVKYDKNNYMGTIQNENNSLTIKYVSGVEVSSSFYVVLEDHFKENNTIKLKANKQPFELKIENVKDSFTEKNIKYPTTSSLIKKVRKSSKQPSKNTVSLSETNKNNVLYVNREKEYYWNLKLFGDKYDVYITDNNTFADKNSYLPSVYAANHDGVEEKQHITIAGENTYEISNIEYFKSQGKTYYRQSKGIMSGPINYYGVANGMLTYNTTTSKYTVDEELRKVMSEEKVKFSMGSKYTSETYAGTICLKDGEIEVELQNDTTNSQFEFGAAIALQYTIVTQASLSESLLNVVKAKGEGFEGTKFTVASDNTIQEVTAINDYFNITFTPGFKNSVSGYTSVQMTLADKNEALILPNSLTTKQILIVMNTKGKIKIEGKKGEEIKRGIIEEDLLSLIIPQQTVFVLDENRYIVRTKNKQDNSITFSTEQNHGYIINSEQEKSKEIRLDRNYMDIASTDFDKTNLTLTLNYINIYTVNKIEEYSYEVPTETGEKLYLITCEEVVNPTNFEVNERSLEKEAVLERQSMILTVKTTDGTALPHLLVEGDSYYEIYSNYIKSPSYYFRTLPKKPLNILYNNTVVENSVNINSASATFAGYCENNISYYEWELYEYYIDDYILVDKFTNKYTTNLFYDCHKFANNTNYKLKLIVTTIEGLKIEKEVYINVQYLNDLVLKNAFVERDCLRQAIVIDLTNARFEYQGITYPICPFSHEFEVGVYGKIKGFYVIRIIKDEPLSATIIGFVQGFTSRFYDYSFQREETYEYSIIPIFNPINAEGEVEQENLIRGIAYKIKPFIRFNTQTICLIGTKTDFAEDNEELQELSNCYLTDDSEFGRWYFKLNAEDKNVSITTDKNIYENNSPFASINQTDRNYKTGSITVMLGNYHKTEDKQWTYKDSIRLQNKFQTFCNNGKVKMLRDEIGNVIPVDVTLKSFDYLPQAVPTIISVSFEWTQVASEENLGVYDYRKENELDKIYVVPFNTREEVLRTPLKVQGLYFETIKKQVPLKEVVILSGQGVEYNESTGFISLDNKAPKTEIIVTVGIKNDESIKTTFVIPAID